MTALLIAFFTMLYGIASTTFWFSVVCEGDIRPLTKKDLRLVFTVAWMWFPILFVLWLFFWLNEKKNNRKDSGPIV